MKQCKQKILPTELVGAHPRLAGLIRKMISKIPSLRPSIIELMNNPVFSCGAENVEPNRKLSGGHIDGELLVKKGRQTVWKVKYLKLVGEQLYLYKSKDQNKARAFYSLNECIVRAEKNLCFVAAIEHRQLETLYVKLNAGDVNYQDWVESLSVSNYSSSHTHAISL